MVSFFFGGEEKFIENFLWTSVAKACQLVGNR